MTRYGLVHERDGWACPACGDIVARGFEEDDYDRGVRLLLGFTQHRKDACRALPGEKPWQVVA